MSSTQGPKDERRRSGAEPARTAGSGTTSHDPLGDPRSSVTPDGLGALLAALAAPPEAQELAGEHAMVAAFSEALAGAPGLAHAVGTSSKRRRKMLGKVLTAKAAAAAVAAVLLGSGVAAATGSLPASLQMAAHRALGAPAPQHHAKGAAHASAKGSTSLSTTTQGGNTTTASSGQATGTASTSGSTTTTTSHGVGPAVPGPSTRGLCVAVLASGRATAQASAKEPTAFSNLEAAATAKGESVSAYCATVLQGSTTSSTTPVTSSATTTGSSSSTSSPGASGSAGGSATLHAHGSASAHASGRSLPVQASAHANLGASVSGQASGRAFGRSHSPLAGLAG